MFDHVTIRVADRDSSRRFYRLAIGEPLHDGEYVDWGELSVVGGVEPTRRLHLAFGAVDRRRSMRGGRSSWPPAP